MTSRLPTMQHIAEVSSTPATYAASSVAMVAGLTVSEWQAVGVIGGLILGLLTYATSVYFRRQHLKMAREKHEANK